jgi:hypothetical protein
MYLMCYLQGAAAQLLDVSSSLTAKAPPGTPSEAVAQVVQRACVPTVLGHSGRAAAIAILQDTAAVASIGRPAALRALGALRVALHAAAGGGSAAAAGAAAPAGLPSGVSRLAEARRRRVAAAAAAAGDFAGPATDPCPSDASRSNTGGVGGVAQERGPAGGRKFAATRRVSPGAKWDRQVAAAERKVFFTMCWANEAPPGIFAEVTAAAEAELAQLDATLAHSNVRPAGAGNGPAHAAADARRGRSTNGDVTQVSYSGNPGKEALHAAAIRHLAAKGTLLEPTGEVLRETLKVTRADPPPERASHPQSRGNPSTDSRGGGIISTSTRLKRTAKSLVETLADETLKGGAPAQAGDHMGPTRDPGGTAPDGHQDAFRPVGRMEVARKVVIEEIVATSEKIVASPQTGREGPGGDTGGRAEGGEGRTLSSAVRRVTAELGRVQGVSVQDPGANGTCGEGLRHLQPVDTSVMLSVVPLTPDATPETREGRGLASGTGYIIPRFEELD